MFIMLNVINKQIPESDLQPEDYIFIIFILLFPILFLLTFIGDIRPSVADESYPMYQEYIKYSNLSRMEKITAYAEFVYSFFPYILIIVLLGLILGKFYADRRFFREKITILETKLKDAKQITTHMLFAMQEPPVLQYVLVLFPILVISSLKVFSFLGIRKLAIVPSMKPQVILSLREQILEFLNLFNHYEMELFVIFVLCFLISYFIIYQKLKASLK